MSKVMMPRGLAVVLDAYSRIVRAVSLVLMVVSAAGIFLMMSVVCVDVIMRIFGSPLIGALDIVKILAAITIACALPYTTAVKGHVAIEYFFLKLSRPGRVIVDTIARTVAIGLFAFLARQCFRYALSLKRSGQVTPTLQIPEFWVLYIIGVACAVVVLVIFHNMIHPGREMIKP